MVKSIMNHKQPYDKISLKDMSDYIRTYGKQYNVSK